MNNNIVLIIGHRIQVAPGHIDMREGDTPKDIYYFHDGLRNKGRFVEQTETQWLQMMKLWLVHSVGTPK